MNVQQDSVVTISYTLMDDDGAVIDSSDNHGELAYLHGHENIVPGLERALEGKGPGDEVSVTVEPGEGYGERRDELVFSVPRDRMPADADLGQGMQFRAQSSDGSEMVVTLVEYTDDQVTLDGNHPLSGQTLHFDVAVRGVREATADEVAHGHVHDGPNAHHH